jgi:hypothetical protein
LLGNVTGEVFHGNMVYCARKAIHLVEEDGFGPSGYCQGMAFDSSGVPIYIDDIGDGGFDMINSQIVSSNLTDGRYIETAAGFVGTFRLFNAVAGGIPPYSAVINGGDVKIHLFHLDHNGTSGVYKVLNDASLQNIGGTQKRSTGVTFLTIDSTATAEIIGNVINTDASDMPTNTANVTSIGNLRVQ